MTSKDISNYVEVEGLDKLLKNYINCYNMLDKWSDTFIDGNLLNEFELSLALDQSTGCFAKLVIVVNGLEARMERILYNVESKHYKSLENIRAQDTSVAKAEARSSINDIREHLANYRAYMLAAQQNILSAQSRLKRLTTEKGGFGVDNVGDVNTPAARDYMNTKTPAPTRIPSKEMSTDGGWL